MLLRGDYYFVSSCAAGLISRLATRAIAEERGATQQVAAQQSNMEPGAPPMELDTPPLAHVCSGRRPLDSGAYH
jgi:hypothetical protein